MRSRTRWMIAGAVGAVVLVAAWSARFRVASDLVDRRLAQAHVPASYRITRIGPFLQRLEAVRIGDPAAPDLVARRIDVSLGYGLGGPYVRAIEVDGARLVARIGADGLSLGAIDRLMPKARNAGGPVLPDLGISVHGSEARIATPYGTVRAQIEGSGNPATTFSGSAKVAADTLRFGGCDLGGLSGDMRLVARSRAPEVSGPVRIARAACPGQGLVGPGTARLLLSSDPTLQRLALRADLDGFAGRAGPTRFERASGRVTVAGPRAALQGTAVVTLHAFAFPDGAAAIRGTAQGLAGTPVAPTAIRAEAALVRLLGRSDLTAQAGFALRNGAFALGVRRATMVGSDGARIEAVARKGLRWSPAGWLADADLASGGGALPNARFALRQGAPGGPLTATGTIAPYRAGAAAIAVTDVSLRHDSAGTRFRALATIDGPVSDGLIRGLAIPIDGRVARSGALAIGEGCRAVGFRALTLVGYAFGPASTALCGTPIVARDAGGRMRIDATSGPIKLVGRGADGAVATLSTARVRLAGDRFAIERLDAGIGRPERMTRLSLSALDGRFVRGAIVGGFGTTSATIANVPLNFTDAQGTWTFAKGAMRFAGALKVADAAESPRFLPLDGDAATLRLEGGTIFAHADLREPTSHAFVATVDVDHRLASGAGQAKLAVPGIAFVPKRLQPEALTPLTLGVIANVVGTIAGRGEIAWGANGVTSSGRFATDRIDLAAAFGPVTGIKGSLTFTDLLGLVSAPAQEATIAEMNPGVAVQNGVVHYQLVGSERIAVEDATWPFAGGTLRLDPSVLNLARNGDRRLTFRIDAMDAAAFVQQLDFPNISATGVFDGKLPMIFDDTGGRIEGGEIVARPGGGSIAYVGELSNAALGTMGKLAFDALKAIRYSSLDIGLDGRLDGEMISRVRFTGVREATPEQSLVTRLIRNLPFHFNIEIRAPFRGLVGSARAYIDPKLLLSQLPKPAPKPNGTTIQPAASGDVR